MLNSDEYTDIDEIKRRIHRRDSSTRSLKLSNKSLYSPVGKTEKDESSKNLSPLLSIERYPLNPIISLHSKIPKP